ncbi:MAG: rhodanese-like domain-containing protein [Thermoanaerobaculia bacterium]|jgi:rhodanese-related sulfurtransferase
MIDEIEISCDELATRITAGEDIYLLDVRLAQENELARIERSTLITMQTIPARLMEIPRDREVIVYCHHGARSLQAALFLRQHGIGARSLRGGIDHWSITVNPNIPRY